MAEFNQGDVVVCARRPQFGQFIVQRRVGPTDVWECAPVKGSLKGLIVGDLPTRFFTTDDLMLVENADPVAPASP